MTSAPRFPNQPGPARPLADRFATTACLAAFACLVLLIAGCATSHPDRVERAATDAPQRFMVETPQGLVPISTPGLSPAVLVDPRNGNRLRLIRSLHGVGDYEVPPDAYGVCQGELLRVDSATGTAAGIVPR